MKIHSETQAIAEFIDKWQGAEILSTGAKVTNFSDVLYNVDGSTLDPEIDGLSWKELLMREGITGNCYVTNVPAPKDKSHPQFNVGGHMTTNKNGKVKKGAISYLMPLCSWHNHTARNGEAFEHTETKMLKLSGYMEKDIAITFMARIPDNEDFVLSYPSGNTWKLKKFSNNTQSQFQKLSSPLLPKTFVLFKRIYKDGDYFYIIENVSLPVYK